VNRVGPPNAGRLGCPWWGGLTKSCWLLLLASTAWGAEVRGRVRLRGVDGGTGAAGQPVVVYLTGFRQPPPSEVLVISQKDKTFLPNLRVIVAGQSVRFTNDDPVVHNVFSTSAARTFDLGKPGPQQSREVSFPTTGLVDVYCNIHEQMFANVLVLPNRAFAMVDEQGQFVIRDVPPGRYPLHVWGRNIEPFELEVTVTPEPPTVVELTVEPRVFSPAHLDKFGRPYRQRAGYTP
jgi:plastocyanin